MSHFSIISKHLKILLLPLVLLTGCDQVNDTDISNFKCTADWYKVVEKIVHTGDGLGHGPDLGSSEWRAVIEFKLGIRGDSEVPATYTHQWCGYINTHFVKPKQPN